MSSTGAATQEAASIKPATGKLGIMIPGMGAVATTLIAGVEAIRRGLAKPIGSTSQMSTIRLGKRTDGRSPLIKDFVPIAHLDDLVFTGWDIFGGNLYDAAKTAQVLDRDQLEQIRPYLESIEPMPAVFDQHYVKRLEGKKVKTGKNKCDLANQIRNDIAEFKTRTDRQVMIWCGSTEIFLEQTAVHRTLEAFEKGMIDNDPGISPSMLYAWAALKEGIPFANGAPNLTVDIPALQELSKKMNAPICGKDFKTGQTFIKTVLAPAFKVRNLGVSGWYSTNILGNRDGEVLDDPEATTKRVGTTSTSSAGSATRCSSRSTSSAATPSSPLLSLSTSSSSWTSRRARQACAASAFRSGSASTSRLPTAPPASTRSMTSSSSR